MCEVNDSVLFSHIFALLYSQGCQEIIPKRDESCHSNFCLYILERNNTCNEVIINEIVNGARKIQDEFKSIVTNK